MEYPSTCAKCGETFTYLDLTLVRPDGTRTHWVYCPKDRWRPA